MLSFIYIILQYVLFFNVPVVNEECDSGTSSFIVKLNELAGLK